MAISVVPPGGRNPQAAIPSPGTGTGDPRLVRVLLPQSSFRREAAFLLPPAVVALPDRGRGSLFIGLRQYSSPGAGQAVPTTSGLPLFSEAIITGSPSVLDAMGDPPLPAECRAITASLIQSVSSRSPPPGLVPDRPRTRAFGITGTDKVPVGQWAEVVHGPGFLLETRIPNQAANADPGAARRRSAQPPTARQRRSLRAMSVRPPVPGAAGS